jgi:hypothetical protein
MKFRTLAILFAVLMFTASSQAGVITGADFAADGDGVITCNSYGLTDVTPEGALIKEYTLDIDGEQHFVEPGHILGPISTLTEDDPKLTLLHDIDNDTTDTWTDYHVQVTMSKLFTFDNVTVANTGWYASSIIQPALVGSDWIGYIDYQSGTPVAPGDSLSFGYRMTFVGSASFCEQLTPSVPEPSTLLLLACGVVGLLVARRRAR